MRQLLISLGFTHWFDAKDLGGPVPIHLQGTRTRPEPEPTRQADAFETPRTKENI